MDIKEEQLIGSDISQHWYYASKLEMLKKLISKYPGKKILDVGAGSGFFSKSLMKTGKYDECICVDTSYTKEALGNCSDKSIRYVNSIDNYDATLVLMMDVIEHVDNDIGLIKTYLDKVPSGSIFFITVPAFQFMWSKHDVFLEHKRRYDLPLLRKTITESGLQIKQINYYYAIVFPIAGALRIFEKFQKNKPVESQLQTHSYVVNKILSLVCKWESNLFFLKRNKLFGLTVVCVAEKR